MPSRQELLQNLNLPTIGEERPRRAQLGRAEILAGLQVPTESPTPLQLFTPEQLQTWRGAQPVEREDWTDFGGPLGDIVKIIDYPRAFVASTIKEIGDIFTGEMPSLGDWWTQGSENYLWGEHLQDWGVDLPGPLDMMLGVGLDVATDVMTYMWGIGALARIGKAGVTWETGARMLGVMSGNYAQIAKGGGKAAAAATAKSVALRKAAGEVGSKRALSAAPQWALKEIGLDKRIGLFVPGTGRLGRWVGFDKLLDYASSGRVTSARARQVAKLPVTEAIWNPDPAKIRGIRHSLDNSVEAMVRREAVAGATPHWYTPAAVRGRMADIAKGTRAKVTDALGDAVGDPLLTQMAQKARVAPVEMWKGPLWTGNAVKAVGGAPGALMRQTFARGSAAKDRTFIEQLDATISTGASIRRMLRSRDPEIVLAGLDLQRSNLDGWRVRSGFIADFAQRKHTMESQATKQGEDAEVLWEFFNTEIRQIDPNTGAPLLDAEGNWILRKGITTDSQWGRFTAGDENPMVTLWKDNRVWWDDIHESANKMVGEHTEWLRQLEDDLYVSRFAHADYEDIKTFTFSTPGEPRPTPRLPRHLRPGQTFRGVTLVQPADPFFLRPGAEGIHNLSIVEQIRMIAQDQLGVQAQELFERDIWKVMDRYLHIVADEVRRQHVMFSLENKGIMFREPEAWLAGERKLVADLVQKWQGRRNQVFDEMWDELETAIDPTLAAEVRVQEVRARLKDAGIIAEAARLGVETEALEGALVAAYQKLLRESEQLQMTVRAGLHVRASAKDFLAAFVLEAHTIGARRRQIQQAIQAVELAKTAGNTTVGTEILANIEASFKGMEQLLRASMQQVKTIAQFDESVVAANQIWQSLSWGPEFGFGKVADQLIDEGLTALKPWREQVNDLRMLMDEVDYSLLEPMNFESMPVWREEIRGGSDQVAAYYKRMLHRQAGTAWRAALDEVIEIGELTPEQISLARGGYPIELTRIVDDWGRPLNPTGRFDAPPPSAGGGPPNGVPLDDAPWPITSVPKDPDFAGVVSNAAAMDSAARVASQQRGPIQLSVAGLPVNEGIRAAVEAVRGLPIDDRMGAALVRALGGTDPTQADKVMRFLLKEGSVEFVSGIGSRLPIGDDIVDDIMMLLGEAGRQEALQVLAQELPEVISQGVAAVTFIPKTFAESLWMERWLRSLYGEGEVLPATLQGLRRVQDAIIEAADEGAQLRHMRELVDKGAVPNMPIPFRSDQQIAEGLKGPSVGVSRSEVEQAARARAEYEAKRVEIAANAAQEVLEPKSKMLSAAQAFLRSGAMDPAQAAALPRDPLTVVAGLRKIIAAPPQNIVASKRMDAASLFALRGNPLWKAIRGVEEALGPQLGVYVHDAGIGYPFSEISNVEGALKTLGKREMARRLRDIEQGEIGYLSEFVEALTEGGTPEQVFLAGSGRLAERQVEFFEQLIDLAIERGMLASDPQIMRIASVGTDVKSIGIQLEEWSGVAVGTAPSAAMLSRRRLDGLRTSMLTAEAAGNVDDARAIARKIHLVEEGYERLGTRTERLFLQGAPYAYERSLGRDPAWVIAGNLRDEQIALMVGSEVFAAGGVITANSPVYMYDLSDGAATIRAWWGSARDRYRKLDLPTSVIAKMYGGKPVGKVKDFAPGGFRYETWRKSGFVYRDDFVERAVGGAADRRILGKVWSSTDDTLREVSTWPVTPIEQPTVWEWPRRVALALANATTEIDGVLQPNPSIRLLLDQGILDIEMPAKAWQHRAFGKPLTVSLLEVPAEFERHLGAIDTTLAALLHQARASGDERLGNDLYEALMKFRRGVFLSRIDPTVPDYVRHLVDEVIGDVAARSLARENIPKRGTDASARYDIANGIWGDVMTRMFHRSEAAVNARSVPAEALAREWATELTAGAIYPNKEELLELSRQFYKDRALRAERGTGLGSLFDDMVRGSSDLEDDLVRHFERTREVAEAGVTIGDAAVEAARRLLARVAEKPSAGMKVLPIEGEVGRFSVLTAGAQNIGEVKVTQVAKQAHRELMAPRLERYGPPTGHQHYHKGDYESWWKHVPDELVEEGKAPLWEWHYTGVPDQFDELGKITGRTLSRDEAVSTLEAIHGRVHGSRNVHGETLWQWADPDEMFDFGWSTHIGKENPRHVVDPQGVPLGEVFEMPARGEAIDPALWSVINFLGMSRREMVEFLTEIGYLEPLTGRVLQRPTSATEAWSPSVVDVGRMAEGLAAGRQITPEISQLQDFAVWATREKAGPVTAEAATTRWGGVVEDPVALLDQLTEMGVLRRLVEDADEWEVAARGKGLDAIFEKHIAETAPPVWQAPADVKGQLTLRYGLVAALIESGGVRVGSKASMDPHVKRVMKALEELEIIAVRTRTPAGRKVLIHSQNVPLMKRNYRVDAVRAVRLRQQYGEPGYWFRTEDMTSRGNRLADPMADETRRRNYAMFDRVGQEAEALKEVGSAPYPYTNPPEGINLKPSQWVAQRYRTPEEAAQALADVAGPRKIAEAAQGQLGEVARVRAEDLDVLQQVDGLVAMGWERGAAFHEVFDSRGATAVRIAPRAPSDRHYFLDTAPVGSKTGDYGAFERAIKRVIKDAGQTDADRLAEEVDEYMETFRGVGLEGLVDEYLELTKTSRMSRQYSELLVNPSAPRVDAKTELLDQLKSGPVDAEDSDWTAIGWMQDQIRRVKTDEVRSQTARRSPTNRRQPIPELRENVPWLVEVLDQEVLISSAQGFFFAPRNSADMRAMQQVIRKTVGKRIRAEGGRRMDLVMDQSTADALIEKIKREWVHRPGTRVAGRGPGGRRLYDADGSLAKRFNVGTPFGDFRVQTMLGERGGVTYEIVSVPWRKAGEVGALGQPRGVKGAGQTLFTGGADPMIDPFAGVVTKKIDDPILREALAIAKNRGLMGGADEALDEMRGEYWKLAHTATTPADRRKYQQMYVDSVATQRSLRAAKASGKDLTRDGFPTGKAFANVEEVVKAIEDWVQKVAIEEQTTLRGLATVDNPALRRVLEDLTGFDRAGKPVAQEFRIGLLGDEVAGVPQPTSALIEEAYLLDQASGLMDAARTLRDQGMEADALLLELEGRAAQVSAKAIEKYGDAASLPKFQEYLRRFNSVRVQRGFQEALIDATAIQLNSVPPWGAGWRVGGTLEQQHAVWAGLKGLFETTQHTEHFPSFVKQYERFINYWKAQAVSTPGFVARNGLGGMWMNYAFGNVDMGQHKKFAAIYWTAHRVGKGKPVDGLREMIRALIKKQVLEPKSQAHVGIFGVKSVSINDLDTALQVFEGGIFTGGQVVTEVLRGVPKKFVHQGTSPISGLPVDIVGNPFSAEFAPFRAIRTANESMETVLRGTLAFDIMQKGGSLTDALGEVYRLHFNYADLTRAERVARRVIPFWKWQRSVIPVLVESVGRNPTAWSRLYQTRGEMQLTTKPEKNAVPDYYMEMLGMRLPWKMNGNQTYWIPDLPFRDLLRLVQDPTSLTRMLAESAAPPVKLPLEIWAGKQFFADIPFSGRFQQVPKAFRHMPFLMEALSLAGKAKKNRKGEWKMRDHDIHNMENWVPFLARFRRMLPDEARYHRRQAASIVSAIFGTQIRINDEFEQRNQQLRNDRAFSKAWQDALDLEMRVR